MRARIAASAAGVAVVVALGGCGVSGRLAVAPAAAGCVSVTDDVARAGDVVAGPFSGVRTRSANQPDVKLWVEPVRAVPGNPDAVVTVDIPGRPRAVSHRAVATIDMAPYVLYPGVIRLPTATGLVVTLRVEIGAAHGCFVFRT